MLLIAGTCCRADITCKACKFAPCSKIGVPSRIGRPADHAFKLLAAKLRVSGTDATARLAFVAGSTSSIRPFGLEVDAGMEVP